MSSAQGTQVRTTSDWKTPFFTIWIGQAFSWLGSMLVHFALIWWLTRSTGSATVLASASLVGMLPGIILGPMAGACVDRWDRRRVMIVADGLIALATLVLAGLFWSGAVRIWHVYAILFVRSVAGTFHWPAMQASTSLMVPKEQLSRVAGMNQLVGGAFNVVAPTLGAILISALPIQGVLGIDVVTAALAITPLFFVAVPQPPRSVAASRDAGRSSLLADLGQGLRYVWSWPGLLAVIFMAAIINLLLNPAYSLLPLLVTKRFNGQAQELGWMNSAQGLGIVAGGLLLSTWGGFRRRAFTGMTGLVGMGLSTLLLGVAPESAFWAAVASIAVGGLSNPIANGPLLAIFQSAVEPEMQGRVFTLLGALTSGLSPLGMAIAGPVADALGVQSWFIIGGLVCLLMGLAGFFWPAIVHLEDGRGAQGQLPHGALAADTSIVTEV